MELKNTEKISMMQLLKTTSVRRDVYAGVGLAFFNNFVSINTAMYYNPSIVQLAGFASNRTAFLLLLVTPIAQVLLITKYLSPFTNLHVTQLNYEVRTQNGANTCKQQNNGDKCISIPYMCMLLQPLLITSLAPIVSMLILNHSLKGFFMEALLLYSLNMTTTYMCMLCLNFNELLCCLVVENMKNYYVVQQWKT